MGLFNLLPNWLIGIILFLCLLLVCLCLIGFLLCFMADNNTKNNR